MTTENNVYTDKLAQIAAEEYEFNAGIMRYLFALVSLAFFTAFVLLTFTNVPFDLIRGPGNLSPYFSAGFLLFSLGAAFGSWRTHVVYKKLKAVVEN